jgi:hypothetical protein
MALDAQRRQKKMERRAAKQKAKKLAVKQRTEQGAARTLQAVSSAPVLHCCASGDPSSEGMQQVLVGRALPNGRVAFAVFLLDLYCLGVKDAMFNILPLEDFELKVFGPLKARYRLRKLEPACARKLVEGAVEYARDLGFPPHADYGKAKLIFGDIDPSACSAVFQYGKDGKPLFVAGPYDNPARCERIVRTLNARCGADGFHFLVPVQQEEPLAIESISGLFDDDRLP